LKELTLTISFLKSKDLKNPIKSFLLEGISILGTLDHKLEPTMMEEDSSLYSKLSDFFSKMDSDQKEHSDSLLGAGKNGEEIKQELFNILESILTKLITILLLLKVIWEAPNFLVSVIQELEKTL